MELSRSIEYNYLLFSDKFRVNHIFFKEKQAVLSGGSRDQHWHWLSRVHTLICITATRSRNFWNFCSSSCSLDFPLRLDLNSCASTAVPAIRTGQGTPKAGSCCPCWHSCGVPCQSQASPGSGSGSAGRARTPRMCKRPQQG